MNGLQVAVMGTVDGGVVAAIEQVLRRTFHLRVSRIDLPDPEFAYDHHRAQYGSVPLLQSLAALRGSGGGKLLGITAHDLFIPMLTFVFGQAQVGGEVALLSTARLRQEFYHMPPDAEVLELRARKEALHEVGHLFGLLHCSNPLCAMALATNINQLDGKRAEFCVACAGALGRLSPAVEGWEP